MYAYETMLATLNKYNETSDVRLLSEIKTMLKENIVETETKKNGKSKQLQVVKSLLKKLMHVLMDI